MSNPFFVLAPMDDVTDTVFRRIVHDCAPADLYVSEFVNVDGLCSPGRSKLLPRLLTAQDIGTVNAQLWGKNPDNFRQVAYEIANNILGDPSYEKFLDQMTSKKLDSDEAQGSKENRGRRTVGAATESRMQLTQQFAESNYSADGSANSQVIVPKFSGIDINFGCPEKNVVRNECCSAFAQLHLRDKAVEIIKATQAGAGDLPVTIKTRLGFKEIDYSWHELLLQQKPSILTIHVRTTKQMSKVPAQWEAIRPIVRLRDRISPETKIVLNGDINSRSQGIQLANEYGVDGIMIGRGVFSDPYCFAMDSPWANLSKQQRIELLKKHLNLHAATYKSGERKYDPLKKFAKIYMNSFDGASELRAKIMETRSIEEALAILR